MSENDSARNANQYKAEVGIQLGGREHILRLELEQVFELEQRLGGPMAHLITSGGKGMALGFIREVLFESIETIAKTAKTRKQMTRMMAQTLRDPAFGLDHLAEKVTILIGMAGFGKSLEEMEARFAENRPVADEDGGEEEAETEAPLPGSESSKPPESVGEVRSLTGPGFSPSVSKSG